MLLAFRECGFLGLNDSHSPLIPITNEWLYMWVTVSFTFDEKILAR